MLSNIRIRGVDESEDLDVVLKTVKWTQETMHVKILPTRSTDYSVQTEKCVYCEVPRQFLLAPFPTPAHS